MAELSSPQVAKHSAEKADRVRDMAAMLFAELFWKQYMAEREPKRRHPRDEKFDRGLT